MILRRSSKVNEKYLKSKTEYLVFCNLSDEQVKEYKQEIEDRRSNCLSSITQLQKIANCSNNQELEIKDRSSKYYVIQKLLNEIHSKGEKFVLFSQSTATLDLFTKYCTYKKWKTVRLDGSTLEKNRQDYINKFNNDSKTIGFLTSTKAGGVGINLIAACKLIMLDISWNPAHDSQATARIWRDGQLKPVTIYRFFR